MSKKKLIYTKDLCDFVAYLYVLKEKTRWQGHIFGKAGRDIHSRVWEAVRDSQYEGALSEGFDSFCESAIVDYLNPHFLKHHQDDPRLKAMVTKASKLTPLEKFMSWVKYITQDQRRSIFVKKCSWTGEAIDFYSKMYDTVDGVCVDDEVIAIATARSSEVGKFLMYLRPDFVESAAASHRFMMTAYAAMLGVLSETQAENKSDFVVERTGPVGVLYTAILISEISKTVVCTLSELIARTINLSAKYRNKAKSETYPDEISVPLCISWLLTNGYSLKSTNLAYKIGHWQYSSSAAAAAAYTFNNKELLSAIARQYLLQSNVLNVENYDPSFDVVFLMSSAAVSTNAAMSIVSVFKLEADCQRSGYKGYKYDPDTGSLVPQR